MELTFDHVERPTRELRARNWNAAGVESVAQRVKSSHNLSRSASPGDPGNLKPTRPNHGFSGWFKPSAIVMARLMA